MKDKKTDKQEDRRVRCMYCDKPIHISNLGGFTNNGFICGNSFCLMRLAHKNDILPPGKASDPED